VSDTETHADRKRRVESVIGTIRMQTGGPHQASPQRAGLHIAHLKGNLSLRGEAPGATERALRAAVERGEVLAYSDREGLTRYAVVEPAGLRAVACECGLATLAEALGVEPLADVAPRPDDIGTAIERYVEAVETPDGDVVAALNQLQQGLREVRDD